MQIRRYKYMREDFGELPVDLQHLNIRINFWDERVEVLNCLTMKAKQDLGEIILDARDLEIVSVEWCEGTNEGCNDSDGDSYPKCLLGDLLEAGASTESFPIEVEASEFVPLRYEYQKENHKLKIRLPRKVKAGESFCIRICNFCFPSDHILEGIYKDATPPGAPQQFMSQCQQWGFQRIMPIIDDCRAKCTMYTVMEGDRRYTHLISNGDIDRRINPDRKPIPKHGDPTRQIMAYRNPIPMAPYLFIACAGTWQSVVDKVTYPSGRCVQLEYLVPPGRGKGARIPMQILKQAILWIGRTQDYEYRRDTYRTICMNKSNFGGMENVGNTTIVTDAALIDEHTLDHSLLYTHAVIAHEFEHNQCGSETTMETPFDVWLNEAYTVDVERQFMADVFEPSFIRLQQVDSIRHPLLGPLAIEDGGYSGRIVREGFNDPDELIDGVTYVKAAEVIRMLRLVLGKEKFQEGKTLYFTRYHNANANTDQFFECFEEVSGRSLEQFKEEWLYRIGYPKVTATTSYDHTKKCCRIRFRQDLRRGEKPFHLPVEVALVNKKGHDIPGSVKVFQLKCEEEELLLENIPEPPAFFSLNRDYSFYGTFKDLSATVDQLIAQARMDPNLYARVDAMRQLTDLQRIKLLEAPGATIDQYWLDLFGAILSDTTLPPALKAYLLRIDEQSLDRKYITWYEELVIARERIMLAVNAAFRSDLIELFGELSIDSTPAERSIQAAVERRLLKNTLLDLIVVDDSSESHTFLTAYLNAAQNVTERVAALISLNRSSSSKRLELLEQTYNEWHGHLTAYANYLRVIASGTREDVFDMIEKEKARPPFDIKQPTWVRALFLPMATNNKVIWKDRGIRWMTDTIIELAVINTTTASRLLNTFQHVGRMKTALKTKVKNALEEIVRTIGEEQNPTIHGQAKAYLEAAASNENE